MHSGIIILGNSKIVSAIHKLKWRKTNKQKNSNNIWISRHQILSIHASRRYAVFFFFKKRGGKAQLPSWKPNPKRKKVVFIHSKKAWFTPTTLSFSQQILSTNFGPSTRNGTGNKTNSSCLLVPNKLQRGQVNQIKELTITNVLTVTQRSYFMACPEA